LLFTRFAYGPRLEISVQAITAHASATEPAVAFPAKKKRKFCFTNSAVLEILVGDPMTVVVLVFAAFAVLARFRVHVCMFVCTSACTIRAMSRKEITAHRTKLVTFDW
jgi:hypothetical protein